MSVATFYGVPAGTPAAKCNGSTCGGTIYWTRPHGRPVPVDCDVPDGTRPSMTADNSQSDMFAGTADVYDGRGVHHMTVCPDRAEFETARTP